MKIGDTSEEEIEDWKIDDEGYTKNDIIPEIILRRPGVGHIFDKSVFGEPYIEYIRSGNFYIANAHVIWLLRQGIPAKLAHVTWRGRIPRILFSICVPTRISKIEDVIPPIHYNGKIYEYFTHSEDREYIYELAEEGKVKVDDFIIDEVLCGGTMMYAAYKIREK